MIGLFAVLALRHPTEAPPPNLLKRQLPHREEILTV